MKRSWLIGAALVFSLTAVACGDDDEDDTTGPDAGDSGAPRQDAGLDSGLDSGIDATVPRTDAGSDAGSDAGDAG